MAAEFTTCPIGDAAVNSTDAVQPNLNAGMSDIFWVFELEDDGTVIYSRPHVIESADCSDVSLEGRNFFDEFIGLEDVQAYRRHFQSFVKSRKAAASFTWRRADAGRSGNARVLMTRAFQTGYCHPTGVVMMEIKSC